MRAVTIVAFTFLLLVHPGTASAHQPIYVGAETAIEIPDPVVSRAYYGELRGSPAVYTVTLPTDTVWYVNILSPDVPGARKDFSVRMMSASGTEVVTLSAPEDTWERLSEEFAGDTYWKGPEFKEVVPAGTYTLTVSSEDNQGAYVLAPGEAEVFTLGGTPDTIAQIYTIKTQFFGKIGLSIFEGVIGKVLFGFLVFVLVCIGILGYVLNRFMKKQKQA